MDEFELHPRLAADTTPIGSFPLCRLLLMDDATYPWLILVPARAGITEIFQLEREDRSQLMEESAMLSRALQAAFSGDKLNIAALGNVVPQLHVHHIVRFKGDPAWPDPVWGKQPRRPYEVGERDALIARLRSLLTGSFVSG